MGDDSYDGHSGHLLQLSGPGQHLLRVAADIVQYDPLDALPVLLRDQLYGPQRIGVGASPLDVDHQEDHSIGDLGRPHVSDVLLVDVDLRRGASALHDDVVVPLLHEVDMLLDDLDPGTGDELLVVLLHPVVGEGLPADDHLGDVVALRLQKYRIHVSVWCRKTGRLGLENLYHGDLRTAPGHLGVQAHVLGLERSHQKASPVKHATHRGHGDGLARIGSGSDDHHGSALMPEFGLHIHEYVLQAWIRGIFYPKASDLRHDVLGDLGAVDEETVGAVPNSLPPLSGSVGPEVFVPAGIERTIAEGAILSCEMARMIGAFMIGAYPATFDLLVHLLLDAVHGQSWM